MPIIPKLIETGHRVFSSRTVLIDFLDITCFYNYSGNIYQTYSDYFGTYHHHMESGLDDQEIRRWFLLKKLKIISVSNVYLE